MSMSLKWLSNACSHYLQPFLKYISSKSQFRDDHDEPIETMRARLLYQSRKRGILETDLLLSTFAKKYLPSFTKKELEIYDKVFALHIFLQEPDWEIYTWVVRKTGIPEKWSESNLLLMLQTHCQDQNTPIRRMPELS
ncbi:hypothetical protein PCANB_003071 [Pneumocystis canis]|nr:hypothetical protein PCK1_003058 [Pneumocystis canis]KAG5438220.1 hypothetical protein PCANB_003071 [Pneumocystis canis]